ncbi:TIGR03086 family metal-binding protein [Nocardioides campestrisoli]|uniref:TIGR03086 family metal-binding protein n=1 Tax=Nocardioides campestrisoli TaxID=2736757 RepID=UPI00163D429C|nr:TIGR03086 family metal-binding protein [Nocardioides campestrisoli]
MDTMVDLEPAGRALLTTVEGVLESRLCGHSPCDGVSAGELVQHLCGLTLAFRAAADKELGPLTDAAPTVPGPLVEPGWRDTLEAQVPALVEAWRSPSAWEGTTRAGGTDLPAQVAGRVALSELVLHGWDLARATEQEYVVDDATLGAVLEHVGQFDPKGTPGLFGPAVPVAAEATLLDQVVARSGRAPWWVPPH